MEAQRASIFPIDDVICYRCHEMGHYAAVCRKKRKSKGKEKKGKRIRSEILCFKCHEKGHFFSRCPKIVKKKRAPTEAEGGPIICFHCKQVGHIARNCSERQRGRQAVLRPARNNSIWIRGTDGGRRYHCGNCKGWGHVDVECTKPPAVMVGSVNKERIRSEWGPVDWDQIV